MSIIVKVVREQDSGLSVAGSKDPVYRDGRGYNTATNIVETQQWYRPNGSVAGTLASEYLIPDSTEK